MKIRSEFNYNKADYDPQPDSNGNNPTKTCLPPERMKQLMKDKLVEELNKKVNKLVTIEDEFDGWQGKLSSELYVLTSKQMKEIVDILQEGHFFTYDARFKKLYSIINNQ